MACSVPHDVWHRRIQASRQRRDQYLNVWSLYARLHTNVYTAIAAANDDKLVTLPNGDQVKAALVYRNIEQTMALLDVPEIGVRATATDYTHELGVLDTHRESVVEQALYRSLGRSGLIRRTEEVDHIKRDGLLIGHGINYSFWRVAEAEVELAPIPVYAEIAPNVFQPSRDAAGQPQYEPRTEKQVVYEGMQDEHVSPLDFLADNNCRTLVKSPWHGLERVMRLEDLRKDPRYQIPDDIEPNTFRVRDLYGNDGEDDSAVKESVKVIVIWDKTHRELVTFIESTNISPARAAKKTKAGDALDLTEISNEKWPVRFDHPDDSPFSFFIPIPANDHPFGISQVEHIRNVALEADKIRSRQANLTRQMKRIPWYRKGRVDVDQLKEAMRSPEMDPVGLDIQEGEDPGKLFGELPMPTSLPELHKAFSLAEEDVRKIEGMSEIPFGGAETATESENAMAIGGARPARKKRLLMDFYSAVAEKHRAFLREFAQEGQSIVVPSMDGVPITLQYGRAAFDGEFEIRVVPGGGASAVSTLKQKMLIEAANMMLGKFGPQFDRVFMRQFVTIFDFRDANALMRAMAQPMGGPAPPGQAPPPGVNLNDYTEGQAIRSAVNAPSEGQIVKR